MIGHRHVMMGQKVIEDDAIMSFQTSYSGTFAPVITPSSGTLIWEVDGVQQETNTPSFELVGDTVDVKVYANDVIEGTYISAKLNNLNIIGTLDFSFFAFNGICYLYSNASLSSITFSSSSNTITDFRVNNCNLSSLDLSNVLINVGVFLAYSNASLSNIIFSSSNNYCSNIFKVDSCNLSSLDLSNLKINSIFNVNGNSSLSSLVFGEFSNSSRGMYIYNTSLVSVDLSSFYLSGFLNISSNSLLSSIVFSGSNGTLSDFRINSNNLTSIDLSSFTFSNLLQSYNNSNLSVIALPSYTSAFNLLQVYDCALDQTTVDSVLSDLNSLFSINTPTDDLIIQLYGGTNASPTNGDSNADILSLTTLFINAGYTFTYSIN